MSRWTEFRVAPLTEDERSYVRQCIRAAHMRPTIKQCFSNAQRILINGDTEERLAYAEGFVSVGAPIHHGWLVIGRKKVVDVTLRAEELGLKLYVPPSVKRDPRYRVGTIGATRKPESYVGVRFTRKKVANFILSSGGWGSMIEGAERITEDAAALAKHIGGKS